MPDVRCPHCKETGDAYSYNWSLHIEPEFHPPPFDPTHESMAALDLHMDQKTESQPLIYVKRSQALSRVMSKRGDFEIEEHGPFIIGWA
ncbi:DUF3412 domain-containing protein [Vibrio lentus]|nr:DUF3412 domain-containing protein [Vibrio lentus]